MRRSAPLPVLFFASAAHGMNHVLLTLYATLVLVIGREWHESYNLLAALWLPGSMLLGVGAPLAGWLGDRWGETRVLVLCFLALGIAAMLCGFAQNTLQLEGGLALLGLAGSIYHPVGIAWVVKHAEVRARAIASTGIAGSIGVALGPMVAGGLTMAIGWRAGFLIPGALTAALGAIFYLYYATGRIADRADDAVTPHAPPTRADTARAFAALGVTMTATLVVYSAFGIALPKMIDIGTAVGRYGLFAIGMTAGLIQLLGAVGQFAGGRYAGTGHARLAYAGGFVFLAGVLPLVALSTGWALAAAAVATVFLFEWIAPLETMFLARFTPPGRRGLIFGIRYALAAIGNPAGVYLVSRLYSPAYGFFYLLAALSVLSLAALACALFIPAGKDMHVPPVAEPSVALLGAED